MDLTQVLEATSSPDTQLIAAAQSSLEQAASADLPGFLTSLAAVLADVSKSEVARVAAGLQLKNYLTSKNEEVKLQYQRMWLSFDESVRRHIKTLVLGTLGTENQSLRSAAQCVAYIAAVELPTNMWPELIVVLVSNVTSPQSTVQLKEASLDAIGYICEDLDPKILASASNEILTAIVQGMRKEEPSNSVRLAATKALHNSLEFTKANFEKENERHFIMQVVCEATQGNDTKIQVAALQNLVKIMSLYYPHMEAYMGPALFAITLEAIKSEKEEVALQGIEFWSTVCDEEADLAIEAMEAAESGRPPDQTSRFYVKGAMQYLVPLLMETLTKQDELDDEDNWNPCKAAGVCLSLMANCCEDAIVPLVVPFVLQNILNQDWRWRDAAIMALGSIMEGPDPDVLQKDVIGLVDPLITLMRNDETVQVRDSAAWTIGRVCERCPDAVLTDKTLGPLLEALLESLDGEPRVAVNACWTFSSLVEAAHDAAIDESDDEDPKSFSLSPSCASIVAKLLTTTDRGDAGTNNLRSSAYEALMDMIKYSAQDCYKVVQQTVMVILERLDRLIGLCSQEVTGSDRQLLSDVGSLLCATLQNLLRKMKKEDALQLSDTIMTVLLKLLGNCGIQEDALMTIGVVVDVVGEEFIKYMNLFKDYLLGALTQVAEKDVCLAGIGLVGDLCRNLSVKMAPYSAEVTSAMVTSLANPSAHQSIKPAILSALGDVALAIGKEFIPFLDAVLVILQQAAALKVEKDNFDAIDYGNDLRDGCLEAYTGIIQGIKSSTDVGNMPSLAASVPIMIQLIVDIANDADKSETNLSNALGLLGDLCTTYGPALTACLQSSVPAFNKILTEGRKSRTKRTKQVALWAAKELKQLESTSK